MAKSHLQILGTNARVIVHSEQTGGGLYQFELTVPPGEGIPPHVHTDEDEAIYVIEGEATVVLDGIERAASAGDGTAFPRGVSHGFFNKTDRPLKLVVTASPGKAFESFFLELDELSQSMPPDMAEVTALLGRYGMTFV